MKKIVGLLAFPLLFAFFASCEEEDGDSLYITAEVQGSYLGDVCVSSNSIQKIQVKVFASDTQISRLQISSYDEQRGNIFLKDSVLNNVSSLTYDYFYEVPMLKKDSTSIVLSFVAIGSNGFVQRLARRLIATADDYQPEESSGITLYTTELGDYANGLCLRDVRPIKVSLADSADIDLYPYVDEAVSDVLTKEWRTNTDIRFARANNFDYANATNRTIANPFESTLAYPVIKDVAENDIILIGRGQTPVGVIKVVLVSDVDGAEKDRYMFNLKRLKE